jgi:hypothetical protein
MLSRPRRAVVLLLAVLFLPWAALAGLSPELQKALADSKYVYISSTRKDGSLGQPAEIWFFSRDGAVYVGTRSSAWRVKRIKAGRPAAKIAVGSVDGPSFTATGSIVNDPAVQAQLLETFARKYPDRWATHAQNFRDGFKDGSRVVVKYVPK